VLNAACPIKVNQLLPSPLKVELNMLGKVVKNCWAKDRNQSSILMRRVLNSILGKIAPPSAVKERVDAWPNAWYSAIRTAASSAAVVRSGKRACPLEMQLRSIMKHD
jgi:hypothetical protein